ncbi:Pnap_2097 family protein [Labrys monachus]|uniref:Biosynthetic protein (TIGR04099 family) n=1 Tax=Labrys monachus TaxID=217067 RepID=A0ABU0FBV0_9HYPH|nr:Pnap_2097 family protein [Labrys monachus]MDQ0392089.1 putative biosynthetic protein (TIGR04099 family) [Labrys monachus]
MNVALRIDPPGTRDAPMEAGLGPVLLGMPHLALNGLSETWLLRELGHRHWLLLARMAGRRVPDFRDRQGHAVYAAFRSVAIADAAFDRVGENDVLEIVTSLSRISRTQIRSRHLLFAGGAPLGEVTMVSVFVHRRDGASNHTVARVEIDGLPAIEPMADDAAPPGGTGHPRPVAAPGAPVILECTPCPSQDFNGAGFLYFTSFVAFADRAEWQLDPAFARHAITVRREVAYHANLDPGEAILVRLLEACSGPTGWRHHCRIERKSDGAVLADIRSVKRASQR